MSKKIPLKVSKGCLIPSGKPAIDELARRNYKKGDIVFAVITKPRNPKFHYLAHEIASSIINNIPDFVECEAHQALKRVQVEAGIECDEIGIRVPSFGIVIQKTPRSISFESMSQDKFEKLIFGIQNYVADNYWQDCTDKQIANMEEIFI